MALLEYRDLTKIYRDRPAVRNINLDINAGRIVGLLGPNGSGKTTLLKMTSGILAPSGGSIKIDGMEIGAQTKAIVSYLPERSYLDEGMNANGVIKYFADFYEDFETERAYDMLNRLGIDPEKRIKTFSKGTKERLQLILVMSRRAKL